jgi:hypothetical protein
VWRACHRSAATVDRHGGGGQRRRRRWRKEQRLREQRRQQKNGESRVATHHEQIAGLAAKSAPHVTDPHAHLQHGKCLSALQLLQSGKSGNRRCTEARAGQVAVRQPACVRPTCSTASALACGHAHTRTCSASWIRRVDSLSSCAPRPYVPWPRSACREEGRRLEQKGIQDCSAT